MADSGERSRRKHMVQLDLSWSRVRKHGARSMSRKCVHLHQISPRPPSAPFENRPSSSPTSHPSSYGPADQRTAHSTSRSSPQPFQNNSSPAHKSPPPSPTPQTHHSKSQRT